MRSAIADGWQREMQRLEAQLLDLQHELRREREQVSQLDSTWSAAGHVAMQGLGWWSQALVVQLVGASPPQWRLRLHCLCSSAKRGPLGLQHLLCSA